MRDLRYLELSKFFFKSSFDAVARINARAEEANNKYDDLVDKFNRYSALTEEVDGRQSQLISVSTEFGTEDPNDPNIKEFTFNNGSVLRYKRTLPVTHKDNYEVVNFETLMKILFNNNSDFVDQLSEYLKKTGNQLAIGSYTFGIDPNVGSQAITFDQIPVKFINGSTFEATSGKVVSVPDNPQSVINKEYADTYYKQTSNSIAQPVFTSGKIAIVSTLSQSVIRSYGKYDVSSASIPGGGTLLKIKLLKYNAKTAWDSTDKSWTELFGSNTITSIPGNSLPTATNKIPFPVDFSVYVEYEVNSTTFPFCLVNSSSRVRAELPNVYSGSNGYTESSLIIDSDGDLCLVLETNYAMQVPYTTTPISLNCNGSNKPLIYVVVRRWSYLPRTDGFIDQSGDTTPTLLFTNQTWMRDSGSTGDVTIRYRLAYSGISGTINWTDDTALTTTFGQDTLGHYVDIVFPEGETIYNINFTANFTHNGSATSLNKTVSLQLKNYVYGKLEISPSSYLTERYDLLPDPLIIQFTCTATGGSGTKTWSVISDADTTLTNASINSSTGVLTGDYSTPDVDVFVKVQVRDATYSDTLRTGTISTVGTNLSIAGGDTTGMVSGDYISSNSQLCRIQTITDSTNLVLETAFSTDLTTQAFNLVKGQAIKKITIHVIEQVGGGGDPLDDGCFSENTYILTTEGGVKFPNLTLNHIGINLNITDFQYGKYNLRESRIREILKHTKPEPMVMINNIDCTTKHLYGLSNGLWKQASNLTNEDSLIKLENNQITKDIFTGSSPSSYIGPVWNIHIEELNYFVSNNPNGPWYLVHNYKDYQQDYQP